MSSMDASIESLLSNLRKSLNKNGSIDTNTLLWTPLELIKTALPEVKTDDERYKKDCGRYQLSLQVCEEGRRLPYGMLAREMFDYFFNTFVDNSNNGVDQPNVLVFKSVAELFNAVKSNPQGTKVNTRQRLSTLEMLLNFESCAVRFKKEISENEIITRNTYFFSAYAGPAHPEVASRPMNITSGEIKVSLDFDIFDGLSKSKRVPVKNYLLELSGGNVMARDLIKNISRQIYRLVEHDLDLVELTYNELKQMSGKRDDYPVKEFNRDLKRAIKALKGNYEKIYPLDNFPVELVSEGRGRVNMLIKKPECPNNFLCSA